MAQNFQPQVRDTTNGPNLHTYIPRSDGSIVVGGVVFVPQGSSPAPNAAPAAVQQHPTPAVLQSLQFYPNCTNHNPASQPGSAPILYQPQYIQQPQLAYQYPLYSPYVVQQAPAAMVIPNYHVQQSAFGTIGLTGSEVLQQQLATAQGLEMNKKQEMKPADDDALRMYWVRELDNTWTQRNRLTIDSGDIGDVRWYAVDGTFYAVRLPMS